MAALRSTRIRSSLRSPLAGNFFGLVLLVTLQSLVSRRQRCRQCFGKLMCVVGILTLYLQHRLAHGGGIFP